MVFVTHEIKFQRERQSNLTLCTLSYCTYETVEVTDPKCHSSLYYVIMLLLLLLLCHYYIILVQECRVRSLM